MQILGMYDRLDRWTEGNGILFVALCVGVCLLLVALVVACLCKNEWAFFGSATIVVGGVEWVLYYADTGVRAAAFFRATTWLAMGTCCLLTVVSVALLRRKAQRKKRLIIKAKGGEGLPERDNAYVRARLHTALRADGAVDERKRVPYENRGSVRLGYARKLIAGVQDAPLSPAERLETETLAQEFARYSVREKWTAEELRAVNELFARLLKLAAKYSVNEG